MLRPGQDSWTEERIASTVTTQFVYSHLGEAAQEVVPETTNSFQVSYAQRTVAKAKRLFLVLIDLGVPEQIFRLIDEYYDDDFLPFSDDEITSLRLSRPGGRNLDNLFYRQQFKYLVRVLREGEHIRYASVEYVPIEFVDQRPTTKVLNTAPEIVRLPAPVNKVFVRKELSLKGKRTEVDFLNEIAGAKPLSHEHVLSVFGSYTQDDRLFLLLNPARQHLLHNFLNDPPKSFEALPKPERRKHFITWPHCLSNALAWLHHHGAHHGAVRPSRIHIDHFFQISLGHFEGDWLLGSTTSKDDLEAYTYAAPEFWKRGLTVKAATASSRISGRSAGSRLQVSSRSDGSSLNKLGTSNDDSNLSRSISRQSDGSGYAFVPAFRGNNSRLKLTPSNRLSIDYAAQARNLESRLDYQGERVLPTDRPRRTLSRRLDGLSLRSSNSAETRKDDENAKKPAYVLADEVKTTMVQTWKSSARDLAAADVFGLAAVTMDILTVMCDRSISSFGKHRAKKNTQAGRGGGLADSSFHVNLGQIASWAETLLKDAEKKAKKDGNGIFRAVGPILDSMMQCFNREPADRIRASALSAALHKHLSSSADITYPHCSLRVPDDRKIEQDRSRAESRLQTRILDPENSLIEDEQNYARLPHTKLPLPRQRHAQIEEDYDLAPAMATRIHAGNLDSAAGSSLRIYKPGEIYDDQISPETFDYYENQWVGQQTQRRQQQAPQVRYAYPQPRMYNNYVDEANEEDDTYYQVHPVRTTSVQPLQPRNYSRVANVPARLQMRAELQGTIPTQLMVDPDYRPPNRDLPAIPTTPNTKKSRHVKGSPKVRQNNVDHATRVLAQTVGDLNRDRF